MKYRLGRKQKRVILTQDGAREVCKFPVGMERIARHVCDLMNAFEQAERADRNKPFYIRNIEGELVRLW